MFLSTFWDLEFSTTLLSLSMWSPLEHVHQFLFGILLRCNNPTTIFLLFKCASFLYLDFSFDYFAVLISWYFDFYCIFCYEEEQWIALRPCWKYYPLLLASDCKYSLVLTFFFMSANPIMVCLVLNVLIWINLACWPMMQDWSRFALLLLNLLPTWKLVVGSWLCHF